MKKTDYAMIVLVAVIAIFAAYFCGTALLGNPDDDVKIIEYVSKIDSDLVLPDPEYFNSSSINPTVDVVVGQCNAADKEVWDPTKLMCVKLDENGQPIIEDEESEGEEDGDKDKPEAEKDDNKKPESKPEAKPEEELNIEDF